MSSNTKTPIFPDMLNYIPKTSIYYCPKCKLATDFFKIQQEQNNP